MTAVSFHSDLGGVELKVIRLQDVPAEPVEGGIFIGGEVSRQPIVTEDMGPYFSMSNVSFSPGARNKLYTHTSDQVLLVTAGTGTVATEEREAVVTVGDIVHIPAGERHWHGATPASAFAHISLTQVGSAGRLVEE